jgi:hypothetical protein
MTNQNFLLDHVENCFVLPQPGVSGEKKNFFASSFSENRNKLERFFPPSRVSKARSQCYKTFPDGEKHSSLLRKFVIYGRKELQRMSVSDEENKVFFKNGTRCNDWEWSCVEMSHFWHS